MLIITKVLEILDFPLRDMSKVAAQAAANLARRNKFTQQVKSIIGRIL
jgi:hypothetical protein